MEDDIILIIEETKEGMIKAIDHFENDLTKIRAGKASPQMLEDISVEYYGSPTPLQQIANVAVVDARTISVQPWEKNMIQPIERAIMAANIGVNPQNDGQIIRIFLPPLTEERRREFVKKVNVEGEQAKISIRNIRRDAIESIKKLLKEGLSEDSAKDAEKEIQDMTDDRTSTIEKHCVSKEKEIMAV